MICKIKIVERLEGDLYAQFKGIFLNDDCTVAQSSRSYGGFYELQVNKNQEIRLNIDAAQVEPKIGAIIYANGVFSVYAQNIEQGALFSIIKVI